MGLAPRRIPQDEILQNPDFEQLVTGIDPWEKPRTARLRLLEKYRIDLVSVPVSDTPIPRLDPNTLTFTDNGGDTRSRWGTGTTDTWKHGETFQSIEDVLSYEPLDHLDLRKDRSIVENRDYSLDEEAIYHEYAEGQRSAQGSYELPFSIAGFYNTLFMWPLLTFGWELFLELAGEHPDEMKRLLGDFAVLSRKIFKAIAKLNVDVVFCHDDICMTSGPVCSPQWLRTNIFPYYEEFYEILHKGGEKVIYIGEGSLDKVADDLVACGADGLYGDPYSDWKALARKYPTRVLAGEGDNRILSKGRSEIERMVRSMVETAKMCGGYFIRVGNCIPHNIPPENVKIYFDLCAELGYRR